MDSEALLERFLVSCLTFIKTVIGLIYQPYKTIRKASMASEISHVFIVVLLSCVFFFITGGLIVERTISFLALLFASVVGLSILVGENNVVDRISRYTRTWSLTYIPTLIWFYGVYFLSILFPPPRTTSLQGTVLSIILLAFSLSLLVWKIILVYLSIRFSSRVHLYRVMYYLVLYLTASIPIWMLLYNLRIFRIPFV